MESAYDYRASTDRWAKKTKIRKHPRTLIKQSVRRRPKKQKNKVISGTLGNVLKPYKNHSFCTSRASAKSVFPEHFACVTAGFSVETKKTLGKTIHLLCFHAGHANTLKS